MKYSLNLTTLDLRAEAGAPAAQRHTQFEFEMHDNLFELMDVVKAKMGYSDAEASQFIVGLKLLGQTALERRGDALFDQLRATLGPVIQELKTRTDWHQVRREQRGGGGGFWGGRGGRGGQ